jgi:hypothetical protein
LHMLLHKPNPCVVVAHTVTKPLPQTGMQKAYDFLWGTQHLAAEIRKEPLCTKMTDADLISILGYVAVVQAGGCDGKGCGWYPGR